MVNLKKLTFIFLGFLLLFSTGCDKVSNTPTKRVEELLNKYQTVDDDVLDDLNDVVDDENDLTNDQRERYKQVLKNQYSNLTYQIKEEKVDGDNATVEVEIEVYDLAKINNDVDEYMNNNRSEFTDNDGNILKEKYTDYKLDKLEKAKDRVKYTLNLTLTKDDQEWKVDNLTETERQKIHGIYNK